MSTKSKPKPLQPLPILRPSHAPRHRLSYSHLRNEHEHAAHVQDTLKNDPEFFKFRDLPPLPYGVWICEDGTQILFDDVYRPTWQRPGERTIAIRADPKAWFNWTWVYWLDDGWLPPRYADELRSHLDREKNDNEKPYKARHPVEMTDARHQDRLESCFVRTVSCRD